MEMDERFTHIVKDPRFKKIPSKKRKVKIDSRFQQMFNDENFNTKYFVDKRGRKVKESASEDLSNFYELSDENDEITEGNKEDVLNRKDDSGEDDKMQVNKEQKKRKKAKKEKSTSDDKRKKRWKTRENEAENELPDEDGDVLSKENKSAQSEVDNWQDFDAEAPTTEDATRRLAVCNMDWDKITADDLFVLLNSFVPSGGSINAVKIYPSDFGLERMEREDESGPTELVSIESDNNESKDQEEEYNKEKLRRYQLNRLKYFYAVVECDSPETAEKIYEECDGMEYEASSSHLDLRFIPEDMTFEQEPTSQATDMPSAESYKPSDFITTALQQSTVRLTWDETDPRRVQTTMRNFSKDDILDMDFKAYLASSSDENSDREIEEETGDKKENQDSKIAKYKELLEEISTKEQEEEGGNEMEITWDVGLKESAEEMIKRKKNEKERKDLTPWENYLNERKQKKKIKQQAKLNEDQSQSAVQFSDDELPPDVDLNDPFFTEELEKSERNGASEKKERKQKKKKKKGENIESEEEKRKKAELQLLMMEDDDGKKHFNLKSIMKNEKSKKKRRKKQEETKQDDFEIDVNDTRFSALYSSHLFAVDPSDPQFKKTKAMESIISEKQRRSNKNEKSVDDAVAVVSETSGKPIDHGLSALVKNVKSNAEKLKKNKKRIRKHN